ncbi:TIM-barrel domain-containing protein [Mucilaginibacter sp. 3215]|uniref:TIM-barrel domain-containing protein n=1 Tax=Mucilaginibacter sp. 3215 TaxID=3373912 RepID=UPI003D21A9B6
MTTSIRYYLILFFLLVFSSVDAKNIPIRQSGLIGKSIVEFVPEGFNQSKVPSLMLQREPSIKKAVPAGWRIFPEFNLNEGKASAVVHLEGDISLYGGGEVTGPLLRNGQTIKLWNTDNGAYGTDNGKRLYQTHPWVMGVRKDGTAFGILFDSYWKAELKTDSKEIAYNTEGPLFRVFVIDRQSPQEVVKGLAEMTGTIEMPPRWALGYQQCRFSYVSEQRVRETANTFREKQIPCDAIWMDIDYMEGFRVFTFNKNNFPNPKQLNDDLHAKGFHSVFMIDPGVKADSSYAVYQSGSANDIWVKGAGGREYHGKVWPGDCAFPDFTMPAARRWWADLYHQFMASGVDGVWNDMNEPAVNDEALPKEQRLGTMPYNNQHRGGDALPAGPHLLYHNAYGRLMVQATRQGVMEANPNKRPFILTRANLLGGQRFAATWTGDNLADERFMKVSVPMSLTLGLSGQPFSGPDIGGFLGNTSPDLWAQWLGFGVFLPFARGHACAGTNNKEPWAFGDAVETTSKIAISRRYRLLPLFYTLFYYAHKTGLPVMQPSFFADPKDLSLRSEEQSFLLGSNLLVVPSFAKDIKLPAGKWEKVTLVDGEESDPYQAKLLLKSGAIIPAGNVIQNTGEKSLNTLTLYINPDAKGNATGELYWDRGEGWEFKKKQYSKIKFKATKSGHEIMLRVVAQEGNYPINKEVAHLKVVVLKDGKEYFGAGNLKKGVSVQM